MKSFVILRTFDVVHGFCLPPRINPYSKSGSSVPRASILLSWAAHNHRELEDKTVEVVAGVDLGGTAINYTLVNQKEQLLIEGLCEHPALAKQGPTICLQQIADGLKIVTDRAGVALDDVVAIGLDTPGPSSAAGRLSARGSTNFVHPEWAGFDIREGLAHKLGKPVSYLNDANAAALWGHYAIFGANSKETSVSIIIGTGNGGGIILDGNVVKGKNGFGGELGHVLIPYQSIA